MAGLQQWIKPGHTLKVIEVRASPVKQHGHQTRRVSMMEMYKVSQLQRRGISLMSTQGVREAFAEEVIFRTLGDIWASLWKEGGRIQGKKLQQ